MSDRIWLLIIISRPLCKLPLEMLIRQMDSNPSLGRWQKKIVYGCSHWNSPQIQNGHLGTCGVSNINPSIHLSFTITESNVAIPNGVFGYWQCRKWLDDGRTVREYELNI